MPSSTFKGRYKECEFCIHRTIKSKKYNCSYSHGEVRRNSNSIGIEFQRDFKWCGLFYKNENINQNKNQNKKEV